MQSSDIPTKFPIPFASSAGGAFIRSIPVNSQIGITDGAASLHDGFPPLNAQPIASGGVPPDIKDMNGILEEATAWSRWQAAGGPLQYDAAFSTAVNGYPRGAILQSATTAGLIFMSTVENNTANPDADPTNWLLIAGAYQSDFANGERTSPDGFMEKWGTGSLPRGNAVSGHSPFFTPFPNQCFQVLATAHTNLNPNWAPCVMMINGWSTSGFDWQADSTTASHVINAGTPFYWRAIGH